MDSACTASYRLAVKNTFLCIESDESEDEVCCNFGGRRRSAPAGLWEAIQRMGVVESPKTAGPKGALQTASVAAAAPCLPRRGMALAGRAPSSCSSTALPSASETPSRSSSCCSLPKEQNCCEKLGLLLKSPPQALLQEVTLAPKPETRTTVILRQMPASFDRDEALRLIDSHGFAGCYDLVYMPLDIASQTGFGYAFVNMTTPELATAFVAHFQGADGEAEWSSLQGYEEHIARYRNSPLMHPSVPDSCKPVVFQSGHRLPFPAPTRTLKAPKARTTTSRRSAKS